MNQASARHQFKTSLWRILWALAGPPCSIPELQARTNFGHDQLYTTLRRLERTGIARRRTEHRRVHWSLTEAGETLVLEFFTGFQAAAMAITGVQGTRWRHDGS